MCFNEEFFWLEDQRYAINHSMAYEAIIPLCLSP